LSEILRKLHFTLAFLLFIYFFPGRPLQLLGGACLYWAWLLHHIALAKMFFSRHGEKKPLQVELIPSASPKRLNCIGKKSISYFLKPTVTGLLQQHC
jgi:hypothetical protein